MRRGLDLQLDLLDYNTDTFSYSAHTLQLTTVDHNTHFLGTDSKERSISRYHVTSLVASEENHSVNVTVFCAYRNAF
jgi:hypothetical protein